MEWLNSPISTKGAEQGALKSKFAPTVLIALRTLSVTLVTLFSAAALSASSRSSYGNGGADSRTGNDGEMNYDAIVNQLNRESTSNENSLRMKHKQAASDDPFSNILFHPGFGIAGLMQTIDLQNGNHIHLNQRGFQASLGIDLFSSNWLAEGTARSFGESEETGPKASVQEFELKIIFHDRFPSNQMGFHFGAGLSGRYLTIASPGEQTVTYTTPNGVATLGIDFFMSDKFSVGLEMNARNAMISETPDHGSYDGTLRMDFHL